MTKSGSSSIQHTLFTNSSILEENGFRYLTEWKANHSREFHYFFSPNLITDLKISHGKSITKAKRKRGMKILADKMLQVINNTTCETLVLSGECFAVFQDNSAIESLKKFINEYFQSLDIEVAIILLVRNPLSWAISALQQNRHSGKYFGNIDFFEEKIENYEAIVNLKKNFSDSTILLKFEDACLDKDGLVGYFLKQIGFPEKKIECLNVKKVNESNCMEAMELINYIESIEPLFPFYNLESINPNRMPGDLKCLKGGIKGVKFDLSYQSKVELWNRFYGTVQLLKENVDIDYTDYTIPPPSSDQETYSGNTIQNFIEVFPRLSPVIQKHFLKFFETKYAQTAQIKYKQLYFKDSVPWKIYNSKSIFLALLRWKIKRIIHVIIPQKIKNI